MVGVHGSASRVVPCRPEAMLSCEVIPTKDMQMSNEHIIPYLLVCRHLDALAIVGQLASTLPNPISRGVSDRPHFDR